MALPDEYHYYNSCILFLSIQTSREWNQDGGECSIWQVFAPEQTCLELRPITTQEEVHNDICNNLAGD